MGLICSVEGYPVKRLVLGSRGGIVNVICEHCQREFNYEKSAPWSLHPVVLRLSMLLIYLGYGLGQILEQIAPVRDKVGTLQKNISGEEEKL